MNRRIHCSCVAATAVLLAAALANPSLAHFPWLATDEEGRALMFFGESPSDRTYHLPEAVASAKVVARTGDDTTEVELAQVEEDDFIGRRSAEPIAKGAALEATVEYGLYHSMLLTYYARHLQGDDVSAWYKQAASKELLLDVMK